MKKKFPDTVARAILKQNKYIKETWVIVLVGITRAMMTELEILIARPGVVGISDTNGTDCHGRWHILVKESEFKTIRKTLTLKIRSWVQALPKNVLDVPSNYSTPQVYQRNGYAGDDDSSSGQDSYMSSCAQSYGSFDNTIAEEEYLSSPGRTYASALTGHSQSTPAVTAHIHEVIVPKATPNEIRANATIASLQAEVKSLQTLLLGATTPSTVTETSKPPEIDVNEDRISIIETNMEKMTQQFTEWMNEL
jgi:hypothetical protein